MKVYLSKLYNPPKDYTFHEILSAPSSADTQTYGITRKKKKKVWNRNKYEAKPNLGNSHLLNPPLLKATEVFQPLLPYHFSRDFGKKKCLRI